MPSWSEYKATARERGALAFELYVAESTPMASPDEVRETLPRHLEYQRKLEGEGKLFLAGPMSDETGEQMQGIGLVIYRAESLEDAKALADADPMHLENRRSYKLRRWLINEGSPSFSTALSRREVILG